MMGKLHIVKALAYSSDVFSHWNLYLFDSPGVAQLYIDDLKNLVGEVKHNQQRQGFYLDATRLQNLDPDNKFHNKQRDMWEDYLHSDFVDAEFSIEVISIF